MAARIKTATAAAERARDLKLPPKTTGLVYYGEMVSTTASVALKNLGVLYGTPGAVTGSVTYGSGGVSVDASANRIDLVDDSAVFTRLIVARAVGAVSGSAGTHPRFLGNRQSGSGGAGMWYTYSGGQWYIGGLALNGASTIADARVVVADPSKYLVIAHRMSAAGVSKIWNLTAGTSPATNGSTPYTPVAGRKVRIGDVVGVSQVVAPLLYNIELTDQEVADAGTWLAAQAAYLGITLG